MSTPTADQIRNNNQIFFRALLDGDVERLDELLAHDFLIIEVGTGSVHARADFLDAVEKGVVVFSAIEEDASATMIRRYTGTAIMIGRTRMTLLGPNGSSVVAASRYSHVFVEIDGEWRLALAQGTPIMESGDGL